VTTLPIVQIGHPALRQRAREVPNEQFDTPELHRTCDDLGTMQHELDHLDGVLFPDRVHDPTTFCTWAMFRTYRQEEWVESIQPLLARFPGETMTS
jgi:peptide deformylase